MGPSEVEGLHVTLKFVGEVSDAKLGEIQMSLSSLSTPEPFALTFAGIGFFPDTRKPRSFWIGVKDWKPLEDLAVTLDHSMEPLGIKRESRSYSPHLTLARSKGSPKELMGLTGLIHSETEPRFGAMNVTEFVLFRSQLGKGGTKYRKMASFRLNEFA